MVVGQLVVRVVLELGQVAVAGVVRAVAVRPRLVVLLIFLLPSIRHRR